MSKRTPKKTPIAKVAAAILERHFGKSPRKLRPLSGGLTNYVFEGCIGRDELIIRISEDPAKLQVFMKEQWAITAAAKEKVPTPEVLEVCNDVADLPYMIARKVPGRVGTTIGRQRLQVLQQLGQYAAVINRIPTHDFGHIFDWSPNKLSRNATWKQYLEQDLKVDERMEMFQRAKVLDRQKLKKLMEQVRLMKHWTKSPSLNHGDIRLKNVVLNEKRDIVAILDWEDCTSNIAPFWDISIALHDLTMDEKEAFLQGYGLDLKEYMEVAPAIKALNILNYAWAVGIALENKDKNQLLNFRARLNGTFDLYSL